MNEAKQICALDYMVGTLATAYKGLVTSLVVKDFCITEDEQATVLKGRILSLPDGQYQVALVRGGIVIAREELTQGFFKVHVAAGDIGGGRDLQLDLMQAGRHIGTFLVKKEAREGAYVSAFEISRDLKGISFNALMESVKELEGIRRNGEELVTTIFSPKKDWKSLSEKLLTFSSTVFWSARDAFYLWQVVFARFSLKAAVSVEDTDRSRAVSNALSIIELALERETDTGRLTGLITAWMNELRSWNLSLVRITAGVESAQLHAEQDSRGGQLAVHVALSLLDHAGGGDNSVYPRLDSRFIEKLCGCGKELETLQVHPVLQRLSYRGGRKPRESPPGRDKACGRRRGLRQTRP